MADPTPLLLPKTQTHELNSSSESAAESPPPHLNLHKRSLDSTIELCMGPHFGWAQFFQSLLVSLAWLFDAQQTFLSAFTDSNPTWHCTDPTTFSCSQSTTSTCHLPVNSWTWDLPPQSSVISEWSLQCSGAFLSGLPATVFFAGCIAGGFLLAGAADSSVGRKNMLVLSCLLMAFSSLLTAFFATNIWLYAALRLVAGFGRATVGTCALVLSTELVGKRWRGRVGVAGFFCFTVGFLSLPAMAYANEGSSWRNLYVWTSLPTILYSILVHFFVCESPRWLLVRGRREEAIANLKNIAPQQQPQQQSGHKSKSVNIVPQQHQHQQQSHDSVKRVGSNLFLNVVDQEAYKSVDVASQQQGHDTVKSVHSHFFLNEVNQKMYKSVDFALQQQQQNAWSSSFFSSIEVEETKNVDLYSAMKILKNTKWACRRLMAVMVVGFGIGMVYYGMPLAVGDLGFNPYLSVTLNALSELPSSLVVFFFIDRLQRRRSLLAFTTMSGVCSVLMCAMETMGWTKTALLGLETVSFFCGCTAFSLLLMYTLELFPTCVRNSAVAMVRQAMVFGGAFSPVLVAAGAGRRVVAYGVFGVVIGFCGMFVVGLPETRGGKICDTIEEEEHKIKESSNTIIC